MGTFSGILEHGFVYHRYEERAPKNMRLGRNMWLDGRSTSYMVENRVKDMSQPVKGKLWDRKIPILDQGNLGSCTGNAGTGALGTTPFFTVGRRVLPSVTSGKQLEKFAVQLYADATVVDGYPGTYPPEDTGSSGLAICKTLKNRKTIKGYRFARSVYGFLQLLQRGPVLQGMPWYEAFFEPDKNGFIDAGNWAGSRGAGGHEVEAVGVEIDPKDVLNSTVIYANSWSTSWGDKGYFRMRMRTYEALDGIDLKQFVV